MDAKNDSVNTPDEGSPDFRHNQDMGTARQGGEEEGNSPVQVADDSGSASEDAY